MTELLWRKAQLSDLTKVEGLLTAAHLPLEGVRDHLAHFWLVFEGQTLIGCAGLEPYGEVGLLRSVAVDQSHRGEGLGQALVNRVLQESAAGGMKQVALLTTTAADYFPRWGFQVVGRDDLPVALHQSAEFQGACPDSAVALLLTFP